MLTKFFRVCMIVTITAGFAIAGISAEAKVKLTMVETITSPERTALIQGFLNEFTQAHPDIEIELISPPYEGSDQKLNLMLNTNQPIDVYEVRDFFIKGYVNNKKLLDLSEFTKDWPEYENLLPLTQKVMHIVDDTPYFIPYGYFIKGLFYRKDILEEKGIAVPTTMAELIEASKKLTDPEKGTMALLFAAGRRKLNLPTFLLCRTLIILIRNRLYDH